MSEPKIIDKLTEVLNKIPETLFYLILFSTGFLYHYYVVGNKNISTIWFWLASMMFSAKFIVPTCLLIYFYFKLIKNDKANLDRSFLKSNIVREFIISFVLYELVSSTKLLFIQIFGIELPFNYILIIFTIFPILIFTFIFIIKKILIKKSKRLKRE